MSWGDGTQRNRTTGLGATGFGAHGELTDDQRKSLAYVSAHRGTADDDFAASDRSGAAPYILATGARVLPLGGFTGQAPFPSTAQFRRLVGSGRLTYGVLGGTRRGTGGAPGATGASTATGQTTAWVESSCRPIPAATYGVPTSTTGPGDARAPEQTLYQCRPGR
ncbi:hypothetical protein [Streptomyces filipinensis]|uniref:hypothetical protein n=1 Tax=Streptomyces filipinensis TaxID=66887 RepID=UPI001E4A493A|nr:hypothetical protein [Streptomyces filipinensis]